ncbi:hypothetical protein [Cellulomonas sp. B6]|uniref:hypothetical protein n=1 Tax=Cellulomonas sp. B6 TaxID=1295626 RepID=UPI001CBB2EBD|nr:hypothetical protein [Cellulomonas sp. B6]
MLDHHRQRAVLAVEVGAGDARGDVALRVLPGPGVVEQVPRDVGAAVDALTILTDVVPAWCAVLGWAVAGLGMGVAFNASTTETLGQAPASQQGLVSSSLQLAQTLATALVAGVGGAALAHAGTSVPALRTALVAVFVATGVLAGLSVLLARRLRP